MATSSTGGHPVCTALLVLLGLLLLGGGITYFATGYGKAQDLKELAKAKKAG